MLTPTSFLLPGPMGDIEALFVPAAETRAPLAVICHPHPLFGGTMHNKVVSTLARACGECGAHTLRFNFRGVGKTAGVHDDGRGEVEDLLSVIAWGQARSEGPLWLAGFSFGAWIAMKGALRPEGSRAEKLVLIAPQITRLSQEDVSQVPCPWILVQGDQDEVISAPDVFEWCETLSHPPTLVRMEGAGHFFHGRLGELRERLKEQIQPEDENNSHLY